MQNIPTLRLSYAHRLLQRLTEVGGGASETTLLDVPDVSTLFKGIGPHVSPERRARDVLRHAHVLGLVDEASGGWSLTPLGQRYVEAIAAEDPWTVTPRQQRLLADELVERASRGDSFASDVALVLSLALAEPDATAADVARAVATLRDTAWQADRTFESQGSRYFALINEAGLRTASGQATERGRALIEAAQVPDHASVFDLVRTEASGRWWWVNQNATYVEERDAGMLWAPLLNKAGRPQHHWETMDEVVAGDQVLHYRGGKIQATSVVEEAAVRAPKPPELATDAWETNGRLVRTRYTELSQPIRLPDIPEDWRLHEGGPFNQFGGVRQGYLFELSEQFVARLLERFPELTDTSRRPLASAPTSATLAEVGDAFVSAVRASGLIVPEARARAFLAAAITKRFVILTGLSGSGKTQLALRLGEWFGSSHGHRRRLTVAVRPDWTGPEALFGYRDALRPAKDGRDAWFVPDSLKFMLEARADAHMPYLLLLDEMNLAHVERYFSDFLSGIESQEPILPNLVEGADGEWRTVPDEPELVELPRNLFVIGTVNVDETTYQFSPKVLDRAFTFEIRTATAELDETIGVLRPTAAAAPSLLIGLLRSTRQEDVHIGAGTTAPVGAALRGLHATLTMSGDEFGHRVFAESLRYAAIRRALGLSSDDELLDEIVLLKILPRLHGSRKRLEPVLRRLVRFCQDPALAPLAIDAEGEDGATFRLIASGAKVSRMLETLVQNQFVSFTE